MKHWPILVAVMAVAGLGLWFLALHLAARTIERGERTCSTLDARPAHLHHGHFLCITYDGQVVARA